MTWCASWQTTAANFPPALSPDTPSLLQASPPEVSNGRFVYRAFSFKIFDIFGNNIISFHINLMKDEYDNNKGGSEQ